MLVRHAESAPLRAEGRRGAEKRKEKRPKNAVLLFKKGKRFLYILQTRDTDAPKRICKHNPFLSGTSERKFPRKIPHEKRLQFRPKRIFSPIRRISSGSFAGKPARFPRKVPTFSGKGRHVFPQKRRHPTPSTSLLNGIPVCFR